MAATGDRQKAWISEFEAWRAERRPGTSAIPDEFPAGDEPLDEAEVYRELAFAWCSDGFPDLVHACSPHRIAVIAAGIRDLFDEDFADVLVCMFPRPHGLAGRTQRAPAHRRRHACADRVARPDADLSDPLRRSDDTDSGVALDG